ncbi:MAG TPA: branched-chain amino acid ABC transporter permease, partial [Azospirillum sp.]
MLTVAQLLLNGVALGAAYALVALGFVLVLNATGAVNFAQGDLVMAGGMLAVALAPLVPAPGIVLLPVVLVLMAGLGLLVSAAAYLPLRGRPPVGVFISTIAVGIVLQNGVTVLLGPEPRAAPPLLGGGTVRLGELVVAEQSLAIVAVAALLIGAQQWVFARTQVGRRLRATAQDPEMARACGVPVTAMVLATFALGTAYAGAAGLLLA